MLKVKTRYKYLQTLLAHSIEQAIKSGLFVAVVVSSDDPQILECAKEFGANQLVVRPQELASDTAVPAIRHCVETVEQRLGQIFDIVVDLDATSPLRNVADIQKVTEMIEDPGISNVSLQQMQGGLHISIWFS